MFFYIGNKQHHIPKPKPLYARRCPEGLCCVEPPFSSTPFEEFWFTRGGPLFRTLICQPERRAATKSISLSLDDPAGQCITQTAHWFQWAPCNAKAHLWWRSWEINSCSYIPIQITADRWWSQEWETLSLGNFYSKKGFPKQRTPLVYSRCTYIIARLF